MKPNELFIKPLITMSNNQRTLLLWLFISFLLAGLCLVGIQAAFAASQADYEKEFNDANNLVFHHEQLAKQARERSVAARCSLVSIKLYAGEELRDPAKAKIECADTIPEDFWLGTPK